jgi:hypothetical protein
VKTFNVIWPILLGAFAVQAQSELQIPRQRPDRPHEAWVDKSDAFKRWPIRVLNGVKYDLRGLYRWETNAADLVMQQDIEVLRRKYVSVHGVDPLDNIPPKPTPWTRIVGYSFQERATGWIVTGEIEAAPGSWRPAKFLLQHPPIEERRLFTEDWKTWMDLVNGGHIQIPSVIYQDGSTDVVGGVVIKGTERNPAFFVGIGGDLLAHAQAISERQRTWPQWSEKYRLDWFAVRVGFTPDAQHLEIWDLGLPPGAISN